MAIFPIVKICKRCSEEYYQYDYSFYCDRCRNLLKGQTILKDFEK